MRGQEFVKRVANRLGSMIDKDHHKKAIIKKALSLSKSGDKKADRLTSSERLRLLKIARWVVKLKLPDYNLKFLVRSKTEYSRVRKFKETWTLD